MFDLAGKRVDEILYSPDYWRMLKHGYQSGVIWRVAEENALFPAALGIYLTSFYDPGLACPYTVSLSTYVPLLKHGGADVKERFLPRMLQKDEAVWQGATWMTEIKGGSDLGATVETLARPAGDRSDKDRSNKDSSNTNRPVEDRPNEDRVTEDQWLLTGDKYFASNAGAELAVVAARPEGGAPNVRGLALFLVPKHGRDGQLNYTIRRLKDKIATRSVPTGEVELRDSEAWLLGRGPNPANDGIYLILEVLNVSRVANSMGAVGLGLRAMADAASFAQGRCVFGKPLIEKPLMRRQFEDRLRQLRAASRLAWKSVVLLNEVWQEKPPYSDRYHLFRLVAHLAKYWTAEVAVQTAKWAMEVHGGMGTLHEYRAERWLREAMILAIWEGPAHRQILDGLEVMERKQAHRLLFQSLATSVDASALEQMEARLEQHLALPREEKEAGAEALFSELARFTADAL